MIPAGIQASIDKRKIREAHKAEQIKTKPERVKKYQKGWREDNPEYQKEYRQANLETLKAKAKIRRDAYAAKKRAYKEKLACFKCNKSFQDDPADCHFHHMNSKDKDCNPGQEKTWARFIKEIDKCIPLCTSCHAILEAELRSKVNEKDQI